MRAVLGRLVNGGHGAASVTSVHLGGCARTTDRALALVARNCPRLSRLELQRCRGVTNGGILDLVTRCPHLQHLDLTGEIHFQRYYQMKCKLASFISRQKEVFSLSLKQLFFTFRTMVNAGR